MAQTCWRACWPCQEDYLHGWCVQQPRSHGCPPKRGAWTDFRRLSRDRRWGQRELRASVLTPRGDLVGQEGVKERADELYRQYQVLCIQGLAPPRWCSFVLLAWLVCPSLFTASAVWGITTHRSGCGGHWAASLVLLANFYTSGSASVRSQDPFILLQVSRTPKRAFLYGLLH